MGCGVSTEIDNTPVQIISTERNRQAVLDLRELSPDSTLMSLQIFAKVYGLNVNTKTGYKRGKVDIYNDLINEVNDM